MKNYKIIFACDIDENRQLVLSEDLTTSDFILAQCYIIIDENGRKRRLFQKNSIIIRSEHISDVFTNFAAITEIIEE